MQVYFNQQDEERSYTYGSLTEPFFVSELITEPATDNCPVTYSCKVVSGPTQVNLCNYGIDSDMLFDFLSHTYYFWTQNNVDIPPGFYTIEFTGSAGDMSASVKLHINIQAECTNPYLSLTMNPFANMTYTLGNEFIMLPYQLSDLIYPDSSNSGSEVFGPVAGASPGVSDLDWQVFEETNRLRTDPQSFIPYLEERLQYFDGNGLYLPGSNMGLITNEGPAAVQEAIEFLMSAQPVEPLEWRTGMAMAC